MNKEEIKEDLVKYGVGEILAQYMMNPDAEELVNEYIKELEEEIQRLETELMMLR